MEKKLLTNNVKYAFLNKNSTPKTSLYVKYCDTFFSRLLGLMFSKEINRDGGIIIVENKESRMLTSIHMMFMRYDIAAIWLDKDLVVVEKVLAKKWKPYYAPKRPAQYVVEAHPSQLSAFSVGDQLTITFDNQ